MMEALLVPEERVGVLTREVLNRLEKETGVKTIIEGNGVMLDGEGLGMLTARNFIKAVGRGFSPERAWKLLGEDQTLEIIELGGLTEKRQKEIKARVIGTGGRMRERIEEITRTSISVYGKTVSVIGGWQEAHNAREAIEMIIKGAEISTVNRWLEKVK
jgi:ribosomal RNA assembly protein